ncbi:hypothetical protein L195_g000255 [Trifolium pratense]|uniref:Uncharacterized protein n=1 Tax=Trifolium pratense TaxID=57577 RepID=A0A2K3NLC8_TRIPR|nr:hypothetical protein L195_g000255 [Trifolium pratense]
MYHNHPRRLFEMRWCGGLAATSSHHHHCHVYIVKNRFGLREDANLRTLRERLFNHAPWQALNELAIYSTSQVNIATIDSLLELQEMEAPPTIKMVGSPHELCPWFHKNVKQKLLSCPPQPWHNNAVVASPRV